MRRHRDERREEVSVYRVSVFIHVAACCDIADGGAAACKSLKKSITMFKHHDMNMIYVKAQTPLVSFA